MANEQQIDTTETAALALANPTDAVMYAGMCEYIDRVERFDEVKDLSDRARALAIYRHQARNFEAEEQLKRIRKRAERRSGELLVEMEEKGERATNSDSVFGSLPARPPRPTLRDLGITKQQSSDWQRLAKIPKAEFEEAIEAPVVKSTRNLLALHQTKKPAAPLVEIQKSVKPAPKAQSKAADPESKQAISDLDMRCPELGGVSIKTFSANLSKEIYRRRKENHEKYSTKNWVIDNTLKIEQKRLLDWIEQELVKLNRAMATFGADCASEGRTQQSIPLDRDQGSQGCTPNKALG